MRMHALEDAAAGPVTTVRKWRMMSTAGVIWFVVLLMTFVAAFSGAIGTVQFVSQQNGSFTGGLPSGALLTVVAVVSALGIVTTILVPVVWAGAGRRRPSYTGRLASFAADNGLLYTAESPGTEHVGSLFSAGTSQRASHRLRSTSGRAFEIGNLRLKLPTVRSSVVMNYGYVAIRLDRALPHIVLEATDFDEWRLGSLPFGIDRSQALALEGDFDEHFRLYCPVGYETDALYVFTPDVMALLIDHGSGRHVELVDDWLFVYFPEDFTANSIGEWQALFALVAVLSAKAQLASSRYWDERGPVPARRPPGGWKPGGELKPGRSALERAQLAAFLISIGVVAVVAVVAIVIANL